MCNTLEIELTMGEMNIFILSNIECIQENEETSSINRFYMKSSHYNNIYNAILF